MRPRPRARTVLALVALLALVGSSCSSDSADDPTTTAAQQTTTTVAAYDLVAAVDAYASAIPEGFNAVGDITAFKDAVTAGAYVIDVRQPGEYDEGHIAGAVNIPLRELGNSLDKIPTDRQVFIYCASGHRAAMGLSSLGLMGFDNISSFPPGYKGWTAAGEPVTSEATEAQTFTARNVEPEMFTAVNGFLTTIPEGWLSAGDVTKVSEAMDAGAFMLDVRSGTEFAEGHIPGATNIPLREVAARFNELPLDQQIISYCKSGHRQAMALPIIHVLGNETTKGFPASYKGWTEAAQPVETT